MIKGERLRWCVRGHDTDACSRTNNHTCKQCKSLWNKLHRKRIQAYRKTFKMKHPWKRTLTLIKDRCNNSHNNRYIYYGGRGIKCLITSEQLKYLWFRDKAYKMKQPSIDRIDNDGNYEIANCRYVELGINVGLRNRRQRASV